MEEATDQQGCIQIRNVNVRYRPDLPLVLKSFSLDVSKGEKLAIIGRTGCGKSTLILTLMRLIEIEKPSKGTNDNSYIKVNGVNVSEIGIH